MSEARLPRDVECPHCEAMVGHGCRSKHQHWFSARTHVARWKAIGVAKPTPEQRDADYRDGEERDLKYREKLFAEMRSRLRAGA